MLESAPARSDPTVSPEQEDVLDVIEIRPQPSDGAPHTGWDRWDGLWIGALMVGTVFLHPLHSIVTRPFWLDEAWVATLTRAPLGSVPRLTTGSVPVGFIGLLKLVPGSGLQRGRLLVLLFTVLTVGMAYVVVRSLRWGSRAFGRATAFAAAAAIALVPLTLLQNDLKQYTSDAFFSMVILGVAVFAGHSSARNAGRRLALIAVLCVPFSSTSAFVAVAAIGALLAAQWLGGRRGQAFRTLIVGGVAGIVIAAYFRVAILPSQNERLHYYWRDSYLKGSLSDQWDYIWKQVMSLGRVVGAPAFVFVALAIAGVCVLWSTREYVLAIAFPVLWVVMAIMGHQSYYPFLDLRTSHFLLVPTVMLAVIGLAGLVRMAARIHNVLAMLIILGAAGGFLWLSVPSIDRVKPVAEDTRTIAQYVAARRTPADVIVVSHSATSGFSYYWPHGRIEFIRKPNLTKGFETHLSNVPAIYATDGSSDSVLDALRTAVHRSNAAGRPSRIFVVLSHVSDSERLSWSNAFRALGLEPTPRHLGSGATVVVIDARKSS